jgi:hypothetical protein
VSKRPQNGAWVADSYRAFGCEYFVKRTAPIANRRARFHPAPRGDFLSALSGVKWVDYQGSISHSWSTHPG